MQSHQIKSQRFRSLNFTSPPPLRPLHDTRHLRSIVYYFIRSNQISHCFMFGSELTYYYHQCHVCRCLGFITQKCKRSKIYTHSSRRWHHREIIRCDQDIDIISISIAIIQNRSVVFFFLENHSLNRDGIVSLITHHHRNKGTFHIVLYPFITSENEQRFPTNAQFTHSILHTEQKSKIRFCHRRGIPGGSCVRIEKCHRFFLSNLLTNSFTHFTFASFWF